MEQTTATGQRSPLEDQRVFSRVVVVLMGLGLGVIFGFLCALLSGTETFDAPLWLQLLPVLLGSGLSMAASLTSAVYARRADRAVRRSLRDAAGETLAGATVPGPPLPARVVRRRVARQVPAAVVDARHPRPIEAAASVVVVVDVLTPDGTIRRVAVLVPSAASVAATAKGTTHLVRLLPTRHDVGVLDVTGDPAAVAAAANDPRWATAARPTAGSVMGGWGPVAAFGVGSLAVGAALGVGLALYSASFG